MVVDFVEQRDHGIDRERPLNRGGVELVQAELAVSRMKKVNEKL